MFPPCNDSLTVLSQDPEVAQAFQEVSKNPANIAKYQDNPKVQAVINKLAGKFGGAGAGSDSDSAGGCPKPPPPSAADLQPDID